MSKLIATIIDGHTYLKKENPFPKYFAHDRWLFNKNNPPILCLSDLKERDSIDEGKVELVWQHKRKHFDWKFCEEDDRDYYSEFGDSFRQVYRLIAEQEVKETLSLCDAVIADRARILWIIDERIDRYNLEINLHILSKLGLIANANRIKELETIKKLISNEQ